LKKIPIAVYFETPFLSPWNQVSYPFSETIFQDFSRSQIDFSRSPKCTIIEAINPYQIKIQK